MKVEDKALRQKIFTTTGILISEQGVRGWNMDHLARKVGIAKNTLYKIIGSKEKLIEQLAITQIDGDILRMKQILSRHEDYRILIDGLIGMIIGSSYRGIYKAIPQIFIEYPCQEEKIMSLAEKAKSIITKFIQDGVDRGFFRNDYPVDFVVDLTLNILLKFQTDYPNDGFEKKCQWTLDCLMCWLCSKKE